MTILNINIDKIDRSIAFQGKTGRFIDIVLIENKDGTDKFGDDGMCVQGVSKEARAAGERGPIIGNFKIIETRSAPGNRQPQQPQRPQQRQPVAQRPGRPAPVARRPANEQDPDWDVPGSDNDGGKDRDW